ncbi:MULTISPECIES: ATP-binding protein [Roseobacteraceae]|uniref:histidine kinase n=1 Tax=Pseudosulfitobacter pseudonitzschiae TaxID=1402135 RepID=A0A221JZM9_9RHOB|nr:MULTISPECIES: ATP-binding protein [Roseobacteraceae]ASM72216.1 osmolarity sensor protein EnvZ [Pseudosulfitobacter pseudonitzschiae]
MSFEWLKHYMPRSLYGRAALILLLPVVFVQIVVSVLFTQRHFEGVTAQMTNAAGREIELVLDTVADAPSRALISQTVQAHVPQLEIYAIAVDTAPAQDSWDWQDLSGGFVVARLRERVPGAVAVDLTNDKRVHVYVQMDTGLVRLDFDRRRVSAANPHQLFVNMIFFSVLITIIALIYLRNQLRPIKRLASASEAFGRGRHVPYTPAGATEVRAAGAAFVDMRNRIERQIETRTLMLSGVSHDLRTPLTRMRLSLSMLDDEDREALEQDVDQMQSMIDEFLNFAKGAQEGEPEKIDPLALIRDIVDDQQRAGRPVTLVTATGEGTINLRPVAMRRAVENLINNAVRYGAKVEVSVVLTEKSLRFRVEDDGPGIPEDRRADAQRPFTRLDPARNQDKGGGVGLGLAIATDIARAHGGVLRLGNSERLGGLQADIVIAR